MSFKIVSHTLSASLASAGTTTVSYPDGTDSGTFEGSTGHYLIVNQVKYTWPADFTLTFGTASITLTWASTATIPSGSTMSIQLEQAGENDGDPEDLTSINRAVFAPVTMINLGAPDTADTDSMIKAATSTEAPDTETVTYTPDTNGTSPTDGAQGTEVVGGVTYWKLDVPRNILSTVTHGSSVVAMTITVTGLDEYGVAIQEDIAVAATGTSQVDNGAKAFKHVRSIALTAAADAEANTVNVGFGDVLGLPVFLPGAGYVVREMEDGAAPTAGTLVAGVSTEASATTGDVRGTYDPNSAADGAKAFQLLVALPDPTYKGLAQYGG